MPVEQKKGGLYIGIPKETTLQENRVALIPSSVQTLTARGHRIIVETGAGEHAHFSDHTYSEAGAEIASGPPGFVSHNGPLHSGQIKPVGGPNLLSISAGLICLFSMGVATWFRFGTDCDVASRTSSGPISSNGRQ